MLGIVSFSICIVLLLSFAAFQEPEPFGFYGDLGGKRVLLSESDVELDNFQYPESVPLKIRSLLDDGHTLQSFRYFQPSPPLLRTDRYPSRPKGRSGARILARPTHLEISR